MAVFITVATDAFNSGDTMSRRPSSDNVRRPMRGVEIKEDRYATLRVVRADGTDMQIFDSSSPDYDENGIGRSGTTSNFLVQQASEQRVEKQQIIQTFGEDYIFFFGEQPRFLNVTGLLLNTRDFNWKNEFLANYEEYLRGTRLVEQNARLYLYLDDIVVEGYLVSSSVAQTTDMPYAVQFQFSMFVTQYASLSQVGYVFLHSFSEMAAIHQQAVDNREENRLQVESGLFGNQALRNEADPVFGAFYDNVDEYPAPGERRRLEGERDEEAWETSEESSAAATRALNDSGVDAGSQEAQSTLNNGTGVQQAGGEIPDDSVLDEQGAFPVDPQPPEQQTPAASAPSAPRRRNRAARPHTRGPVHQPNRSAPQSLPPEQPEVLENTVPAIMNGGI